MFRLPLVLVIGVSLSLSACTVTPENAFPEATTPQQCFAAFEQGKIDNHRAEANAAIGSNNALGTSIGVSIGRGINESVNKNRYAICLQRVGATEEDLRVIEAGAGKTRAAARPDRATPVLTKDGYRSPGCPRGASGLYGGTLYC